MDIAFCFILWQLVASKMQPLKGCVFNSSFILVISLQCMKCKAYAYVLKHGYVSLLSSVDACCV